MNKRDTKGITLMELICGITVAVLIVLAIIFIAKSDSKSGPVKMGDIEVQGTCRLETVAYDGHVFILRKGNGGHFIHHPDCPCMKERYDTGN